MAIDDIRKRYGAQPSNLAEEVKRLRAENAQQKKDIIELLDTVDRLQGAQPPGPPIIPGAEDAAIDAELAQAGVAPTPTVPRVSHEAENVSGNIAAGRVQQVFQTARGLPITAEAFDTDYTGPR
jgi:hypothetical protein